jgi:signal transduction histidine kinase
MELHDSVGQMLTAIKFKTENYVQEKGKKRGEDESLEVIISLIKETIEEVRRMQMDLHPSTLDDLGVLATLGWFCREYQKIYSHIRVEKEIAIQENEVSTPLKVVLYRLTQEAMNNIAKHSQANLVRLTLRKQKTQLEWMIEDNGTGFDLEKFFSSEGAKRGLGLSSMRERAELSGGKFVVESTQGKGTILRANWPL